MDPQKVVKSSTTFTIGSKTSSPSLAKSWRSSGTPSKTLPETHQSPIKALRSPLWHQQRLWKFTVLLMMSSRTHRKSPCWTFASAKVSAACTTDWRLIDWWFVKVSVSSSSELNFMNLWILITLSHFVSFLSFTSLFAYFVCLFSAFFCFCCFCSLFLFLLRGHGLSEPKEEPITFVCRSRPVCLKLFFLLKSNFSCGSWTLLCWH